MYIDYHVTEDSFGSFLPANWEEIAAYLNDKIDAIIDRYGDEADNDYRIEEDMHEEIRQVWEDYCNGKFDADITTATVDVDGLPYYVTSR